MDSEVLKHNDGTNTGTCSDDHKCACKASFPHRQQVMPLVNKV